MPKSNNQITEEIHKIAREFSQQKQKPFISILQPRRNLKEIPAQQLQSWQNRSIDCTSVAIAFHAIDGNPVDIARCYLIEKALEDDCKYALFIDEDTVLPYYGVTKMVEVSKQFPDAIITGIYYVKFGNVMMSVQDEKKRWVLPNVNPDAPLIRNVCSTGLGCALIPLHIIKKIKLKFKDIPLFCIVPENTWGDKEVTFLGEDTWFYNLVHKTGFEIIGVPQVQCLHIELSTGKYAAHPDVKLIDYLTNIPITTPLTMEDRIRVSKEYIDRICKPIIKYQFKNQKEKDRIFEYWNHKASGESICSVIDSFFKESFIFCELGCEYAGLSDLIIQEFKNAYVFGIDIVKQLTVINLEQREKQRFQFILGSSLDVYAQFKNETIDFIYIDTDPHTKNQLQKEINLWIPKVKSKGIVAFHDYNHPHYPDVKKVIDEYCKINNKELFHLDYFNVYFQK